MSVRELLLLLGWLIATTFGENLRPPYLNLAREKHITVSATSTCGEFIDKDNPNKTKYKKELYCKLTGSSPYEKDYKDSNLIYGQYCDYCDHNIPDKKHIVNYTIDGTDRWWQSPPLSRGLEYQKVNITINLGQEYHIAYVYIRMANSPRPAVWSLERSTDYGKTFSTWYYFASDVECRAMFGIEPSYNRSFTRDDDVVCETKYASRIPLEGGEMVVSLINDRPNIKNFSYSDTLQQWTRATNVRIRLLRPTTLHSHSIIHDSHDKTVTRRYFHSIRDIGIGGHCQCNGHAESCDKPHSKTPNKMVCRCRHNTCGDYCQECCEPYVQKKWRQSRDSTKGAFECEPCQCYGHSTECIYDEKVEKEKLSIDIHGKYEGGGRCLNCQHHTEGINCERCIRGYFRNFTRKVSDIDMCQSCKCNLKVSTGACAEGTGICECKPQFTGLECDECAIGYFDYAAGCKPCLCSINGTADHKCLPDSGRCVCKMNFEGDYCDRCAPGYYNFKAGCVPCECERAGSDGNICDAETGQCPCRLNYQNRTCNTCKNGHFGYPGCLPCVCNYNGSTLEVCNKDTGVCLCKANFTGHTCELCAPGFFNHPTCEPCACDPIGVVYDACDQRGQCHCKPNFGGRQCNQCAPGYFRYPDCVPCSCDMHGSLGLSCDQTTGQCVCKSNFIGVKCQECAPGLFNFPYCEECKCVPAGVRNDFPGCGRHNIPGVLCLCKQNVEGRQCDRCKEGFWNMKANNPLGCEPCDCSDDGTLAHLNTCDSITGQCPCKLTTQNSTTRCDICTDGYYALKRNDIFGCEPCRCSLGGSLHSICDKQTGQCVCRPSIVGRECNQPAIGHYFPTLHHLQYELEDSVTTKQQTPVRYEFDLNEFENYSWKGYVRYSSLQSEVQLHIQLMKPTAYRLLIRYKTYNGTSVNMNNLDYKMPQMNINFAPVRETGPAAPQTFDIDLPQSDRQATYVTGNSFLTSDAAPNNEYLLTLKTSDPILVDYIVFIPIDYIEAQALQQTDAFAYGRPCELDNEDECYQYYYPLLNGMSSISHPSSSSMSNTVMVDSNLLQELSIDSLTTIERGRDYRYDWFMSKPGQYYLLVDYHTIDAGTSYARIQTIDGDMIPGSLVLTECPYTFVCRQLVTTLSTSGNQRVTKPKVMTVTDTRRATVILNVVQQVDKTSPIGIQKITAVPVSQFNYDLLRPKFSCVRGSSDDSSHGLSMCDDLNKPSNSLSTTPIQIFQAEDYYNEHLKTSHFPSAPANTSVVPLNFSTPNIYVYGRLTDTYAKTENYPATFQFHIHYYQLNSYTISDTIPLTVIFYSRTGDSQIGEINAPICQRRTLGGCSQIVTLQNGSTAVRLDEPEFTVYIALVNPNTSLLIDYLTAQKIEPTTNKVVVSSPTAAAAVATVDNDRASKFVQECVRKSASNYDLKIQQASPFCRQALYSLSATFNEQAYPCICDVRGSTDPNSQCEPYGGQCSCKPNVIGRRCNRCRTGYWGFPNCRPCTCPTKICNELTGDCICPPRVTGRYCDQCAPRTYGFDPLIGCEDCQCRIEGVINGRLDCDLRSGQCPCRENIGSRTCDRCASGHFDYPRCLKCDCDSDGTLEPICDTYTGTCLCKENVYGPQCDRCIDGSFALLSDNPKGCTNCYCFGATKQCHSGLFNYRTIRNMSDWSLTRSNIRYDRREGRLTMFMNYDNNDQSPIYWSAPRHYLGNKILAYGGNLTFKLSYTSTKNTYESNINKQPLVILRGRDLTIVYYYSRSLEANYPDEDISITLKEANFRFQTRSSTAVTRETFLQTLSNLSNLHILAWPYSLDSTTSSIANIQLQQADFKSTNNILPGRSLARTIEVCSCPPNYAGTSCETCAQGYYKQYSGANGAHNYICIPCKCNGQSDICDVETGHCLACQNHTTGTYCEKCIQGYNGDPTQNISCRICACPLSIESNNFASTCEMNITTGETTKCFCQQGYYGDRCQSCYPAYWGEPNKAGSRCISCECNSNIDPYDWNACDQQTGRCINCLNNTSGPMCERCRDWFYGDAIQAKNCAPCICSQCGSLRCDHISGRCQCKPGVTGVTCDVCLENHYGYHACNDEGCKPCACGLGSIGPSCDLYTGQCQCKPGVGGRNCDVCLPGYWDLTENGCKPCQCDRFGTVRDLSNTGLSCDAQTGRCYCIEGVRGERCDQCEEFYTIVEGRGCLPCDKSNVVPEGWCARQLIDDVDYLRININRTIENADRITQGRTANERIQRMRLRANEYRSLVNNLGVKHHRCLLNKNPSSSSCLNEQIINLTRLLNEFDNDFKQTQIELNYEQEEVKQLLKRVQKEYERVQEQIKLMKDFADDIEAFSANLTQHTNDDPTYIIDLIDNVYTTIERFDIEPEQNVIKNFSQLSSYLYTYLQTLSNDLNKHINEIDKLNNQTFHFEQRTSQMEKHIQQAYDKVQRISEQVSSLDDITLIRTKLKQSITLKQTTDIKLSNISQLLQNDLIKNFNQLQTIYSQTLTNAKNLHISNQALHSLVNETQEQNRRIHNNVREIFNYVQNLTETSQYLEILYDNMKKQNNATLFPVFVYKNIIDTVNLLDLTSNELIKNLSYSQEHIYQQRQRIEQLEKQQLNQSLLLPLKTQIKLNIEDEQRLERVLRSSQAYEQSLSTSEKLLPAYKLRINELKSTADNLEPHSTNIYDDSQTKTQEFARLREKILAEKPMNASTISDRPLQMEFTDITDGIQYMKRWEFDTDEQLRLVKYSYDQTINLQENIATIIADIRRLVDESRSIVSSVRVGAQFNRTNGVNLHRPYSKSQINLNKQHSKLALSFRTTEPDGLLAYAGSENDDRYMSLRLNQNGQVEFTYDLGQQRPMSIITPQTFIDNQWYDVTGERIGSHGHLTVVDSNGKDIFVGTSDAESGGQSMLDLSDDRSVLLIGGVPVQVSLKQTYTPFSGSISNVRLDDYSVSLWNFQSAMNYNQGSIPSVIHHEAVPGISLKGDGYVIFSKRRLRRLEHSFLLTIIFKTHTPNGLLLAYGGGDIEKRFFAVQIIDSHPEILMNTGSGLVSLRLDDNVHDNKLHRLQIKKQNTEIIVQLDNQQSSSIYDRDEESRIEGGNDNIYVGKYFGQDSLRDAITSRGFSGCIQSILIDRIELTFKSEHFKRSGNVETTCSIEQILHTVQFNYLDQESYVEISEKNLTLPWAITARFQTTQSSGTLLYMNNENEYMNKLIIYFEQNYLMIKHKDLPIIRCENILSTNWWNYISIYRDTQSYRLYLNDTECGKLDIESEYNNYQLFKTIFIGGVPQTISNDMQRLIGCIGDVNIDGSLINFNNVIKLKNAERNCQSNGILNNNYNKGPVVYPPFDYNASQQTYPERYQLKLFQLNDDSNNKSLNSAMFPSTEIIDELTSTTFQTKKTTITTTTTTTTTTMTTTTTTIMTIVTKSTSIVSIEEQEQDEDNNYEDEESFRTRRSCRLPRTPSNDRGREIGYRFGDDHRESRALITIIEPSISLSMNISFKFRTQFTHGLLFYSGSDPYNSYVLNEFIAVWLHKGRLVFAFDCGSGKGEIESINRLNDDNWHQVDIIRNGNNATLFIDSLFEGFIIPPGSKLTLETDGIYHFGNIPSDEKFLSHRRRQLHHFKNRHNHLQFQGCISTIQINNQPITFDINVNNEYNFNIKTCFENEESGVFINGEQEIILENSFRLGQRFNISFHFKSRVKSGLLLASTSINDDSYLFIYLDKGNIVVTLLQNSIDEVHVVHWPNDINDNEMCDGHWHTVDIQKDLTFIRLYVDKYEPDEELLSIDYDLNTNGPLYIGRMNNLPAIVDDIPVYSGCITNLKIIAIDNDNDEHNSIRHAKALHLVDGIEYSCPTN
ncbi:unnamed protein product [Rotaria sordida]|uniref:Laminin subunit alpha n=1 Tax=Rotaria sordida TaxID=392033 RepID=A0A814CF79_9BILA|nr:unnamed protein product [Rotaria sordida]CAF1204182.1 unnamed protein product [Rotaria sordida]